MQSKATDVDAYLAELPADRREGLGRLRKLVNANLPRAVECMRYGMPSYEMGELLCAFASQKQYYALYVMDPTLVEWFRPRLGNLSVGKGCIRFRDFADLPAGVIAELLCAAADRRERGETAKPCD